MCEFCTKHGEGKIWYKNAANYANDLLSDIRRRTYIRNFLSSAFSEGFQTLGRLETIFRKKGRLPNSVKTAMISKGKGRAFRPGIADRGDQRTGKEGQSIVRMPCACRWNIEKKEVRCCYAISYGPDAWFRDIDMGYFGKTSDEGLESLSPDTAIQQMEEMEEDGAVHTIWTMMTPFIGAICNCSPEECIAMRTLTRIDIETMARAEHVASVDEELCSGCGLCDLNCHFKAITSVTDSGKSVARIDPTKCFGCGLCRRACDTGAISLLLR